MNRKESKTGKSDSPTRPVEKHGANATKVQPGTVTSTNQGTLAAEEKADRNLTELQAEW